MLYAIFETNTLLGLIEGNESSKTWRFLYYLMLFFLLGYGAVALMVSHGVESFIFLVIGSIFMLGSCFVASVVKTSMYTIRELQTLAAEQLETQRDKETAEAIAKLHTEFLTMISHELRTPLNAIVVFSEMLEDSIKSSEDLEFLKHIQNSGNDLANIVETVLKYTEIKSGNFKTLHESFNLKDVVEASLKTQSQLSEQPDSIKVSCTFSDQCPTQIDGDRRHLEEVFNHLLNNAFKFTNQGEIYVGITINNSYLYCTIQDTGIGIAPEHIQSLFRPFSMGDTTTTRQHGGLGLGLILAQGLLEAMGGQIWMESQGLIAGTPPQFSPEQTHWQDLFELPNDLIDQIKTQVFFRIPSQSPT